MDVKINVKRWTHDPHPQRLVVFAQTCIYQKGVGSASDDATTPLLECRPPGSGRERQDWEHERTAAYQSHSGDADVVSTVPGDGNDVAFVELPEMVEGAPLMAVRSAP